MSSQSMKPLFVRMHPKDNVAVVVNDGGLPAGSVFSCGLTLVEAVPQGHKVALTDLKAGDAALRYSVVIGYLKQDIPKGGWVNEDRLEMPPAPELEHLAIGTEIPETQPPLEGYTFEGYRNPDGSVGTRNILGITITVQCAASVVQNAVVRAKAELLPQYPHVDDIVLIEHIYGCGVAIDAPDAPIPIRTVRNLSLNPNFGGEVLMVSLGCEKLQPARLMPDKLVSIYPDDPNLVILQEEQGYQGMMKTILQRIEARLKRLNERRRETCPVSDLVLGVQCGGSDAFSGITANPAIGFASDLIVRAGGISMFSEVTEVRDSIETLTKRAATPEVGQELIREMDWYDKYLAKGGVDRSANTTPGNKKGGLSNIVEKALGSIIKSGHSAISGVIPPGERVDYTKKGLYFAATPASDFVCGTLQLAAGMNMHVFSTGRGNSYGLAMVPVIKIAARTVMAERWNDLFDISAGKIATGEATIEEVGWELFHLILDIASGRKQTWTEQWKLHNSLALFNPAPIT